MPRNQRPHMPGVPFHLTARLQGHGPHFQGLEPTILRLIGAQAERSDGRLLAYAIMPNHLHFVYAQGAAPLRCFMQPLLRRIAFRIQAHTHTSGHVFEREYASFACTDVEYLRTCLVYVHLNPVRARMCSRPEEYEWTSHNRYLRESRRELGTFEHGLQLFASRPTSSLSALRSDYARYLEWRLAMDARTVENPPSDVRLLPPPPTPEGDALWHERYGAACQPRAEHQLTRRPVIDLRDLAVRVLAAEAPDMALDRLRSGRRSRDLVAVRRRFIERAKENGHRNRSIARFLRISDGTVSRT